MCLQRFHWEPFNIPPGSVRVSAGGQTLIEGADYEVDYNIGRVKILNDAILNSGVPVNVSYEDNTLFGFQTKTMLGLRADYEVNENFNIGATYLHLFERPFTQKVNVGDDPINNKIYGLDINLSQDAPFLTKMVDAIPLINTKEPSNIAFSAEGAWLKPGHARAINADRRDKDGVVYIDDFEGSASSFDLRVPVNNWFIASVPQNDEQNRNPLFPESTQVNSLVSGVNRAHLNWYRIDPSVRNDQDDNNPYVSLVPQIEVFPNLQLTPDQLPNLQTFDLTFDPTSRGAYNFDTPGGVPGISSGVLLEDNDVKLVDPETRWGGVMRALNTNDFQAANIEFLEFWMLSPFHDPNDGREPNPESDDLEGELYINLGNISEDILRDSRKMFENGLPGPINPNRRVDTTNWSVVPIAQQITNAFDNDEETRTLQDVGLDGLDDEGERTHFDDYLDALRAENPNIANVIANDPANDNFRYYRDESFPAEAGIYERYRQFNNQQGNSAVNQGGQFVSSSTNIPDSEDLNRDNTLNETESYFQYRIPLRYKRTGDRREIDIDQTPFITDQRVSDDDRRIWYRFKIPLDDPSAVAVGGIRDFRSIRFMRMYLHGFRKQVTLRFARLELVRNQWRRYMQDLETNQTGSEDICDDPTTFDVNAVNIEENSSRVPFNYVLPEGIQREQSLGVFNALQNEQSLALNVQNLCDGDEKAIFKIINMDMRVYERLRMFVHAEELNNQIIDPGELTVFMRLGSDFKNNYYEYEIPLTMSDEALLPNPPNPNDVEYKLEVWRTDNEFNFPLDLLKDVKVERNNTEGQSLGQEFVRILDPTNPEMSHQVKVRGNPSLGLVKVAMVGVRNRKTGDALPYSTEVWFNELRLTGLDERGGAAAIARLDMQLADFGNVTVAGNYSTIGFGALDEKLIDRNREEIIGYDLATNLELGKFFPDKWGLRLPFYAQFSNQTKNPQFDPYDLDLELKEKLAATETVQERDSIKQQAQDVTTIKGFNFTNVRKERGNSQKKPMPWDISNFSATYSYTETDRRDPIIESDNEKRYSGVLDYTYTRRANYLTPLKKVIKKDKYLKLFSEFNLNPLPNSFSFSTVMDRTFATTSYRFTGLDKRFNTFFKKRFTWGRNYDLQWDITKSLKFNFSAVNDAYIDEPDEIVLLETLPESEISQFRRDSIWNNIRDFGRTKNYRHNISINYDLPIKYIPYMDWVKVKAQYQADYSWTAAALNLDSLGNVIQNSQNRQVNVDFNFEQLYNKVPYLKKINRGRRPKRNSRSRAPSRGDSKEKEDEDGKKKKKRQAEPSPAARALLRPLMLVRKARLNYSERFTTVVPGFTPTARLMGLSSGFEAPGWDFVAGFQPRIRELTPEQRANPSEGNGNWLYDNREWITNNVFLNQEVIQEYTQDLDGRLTIEPFSDFRIDVEASRAFTENHSEYFKDTLKDNEAQYVHVIPKDIGSMTVSYSALSTLFQGQRDDIRSLFQTFEQNRVIISNRLGTGIHEDPELANQGFTDGYGSKQQDVLIPAFIAAYTDQDPTNVGLDIFDVLPRVNWRLTYNGLTKIPLFKDIFQNFSVTHSYRSTLTVNRFNTGLDFLRTTQDPTIPGALQGRNELNGDFYARLEIPEIAIQESFAPLIALDMTMQNGMSMNVDYKKARTLALSFINNQLNQTQTTEVSIGFGYLMKEVDIPFLTGSKKKKGKRKKEEEDKKKQEQNNRNNRGGGGRGGQLEGQDLDINFNFSLRDDVTYALILDSQQFEPTRGTYSLSLSPSAEYKLNQRLSLRLFFDYRRNVPQTSAGFPRTDTSGGVVVRFQLN